MSLLRLILKAAAPLPDIEKNERFLFIGPHPDDIEIGAGATAAKLAAAGKSVCFESKYDKLKESFVPLMERFEVKTPEELIEIRKAEAVSSAKMLGVSDVRFLNLSDGGFYDDAELIKGIAQTVGDFKPDTVFAPDPCVTNECHADHLNVGNAARRIAYFAPYGGIMCEYGAESAPVNALCCYMTAKPNKYVKTSGFLNRQLDAIFKCHQSQFSGDSGRTVKLYLKLRSALFGLHRLSGSAEGFRVLGTVHMHCLPEAGN